MFHDKEIVRQLKERKLLVFEDVHHIKFEAYHGCNLNCDFCGISRETRGAMGKETFLNAIEGLNPEKFKIAFFSGSGEPTLNPNLKFFISTLRERFPRLQINVISNMVMFQKKGFDKVVELFEAGLSQLQADLYTKEAIQWFQDSLNSFTPQLKSLGVTVCDCYKTEVGAYSYKGGKSKRIVYVTDDTNLNTQNSATRRMHNFGGNLEEEKWPIPMSSFPLKRSCSEPFKYVYLFYDGDVTHCCRNGGRSLVLGNVNETLLTEIWQSKDAQIVRWLCKNGKRELLIPCLLCNYRSFRDGLYPYWGGDFTMKDVEQTLDRVHRIEEGGELLRNIKKFEKNFLLPEHIANFIKNHTKEK
jgi:radical SAM protein with 4Fe4S-binding SPASM domain